MEVEATVVPSVDETLVAVGDVSIIDLVGVTSTDGHAEEIINNKIALWQQANPEREILDVDLMYITRVTSIIILGITIFSKTK